MKRIGVVVAAVPFLVLCQAPGVTAGQKGPKPVKAVHAPTAPAASVHALAPHVSKPMQAPSTGKTMHGSHSTVGPAKAAKGNTGGPKAHTTKATHSTTSARGSETKAVKARSTTKATTQTTVGTATTAKSTTSTTGPSASSVAPLPKNQKLVAKLQGLLPPGTDMQQAAAGFKNQGQFVAAVHVSNNLGIPFNQLKAKMIDQGLSLGQAIQALKPTANGTVEAEKAQTIAAAELSVQVTTSTQGKKK